MPKKNLDVAIFRNWLEMEDQVFFKKRAGIGGESKKEGLFEKWE